MDGSNYSLTWERLFLIGFFLAWSIISNIDSEVR